VLPTVDTVAAVELVAIVARPGAILADAHPIGAMAVPAVDVVAIVEVLAIGSRVGTALADAISIML
jgi:hypothetical protein